VIQLQKITVSRSHGWNYVVLLPLIVSISRVLLQFMLTILKLQFLMQGIWLQMSMSSPEPIFQWALIVLTSFCLMTILS